jgi:hypothetical protein
MLLLTASAATAVIVVFKKFICGLSCFYAVRPDSARLTIFKIEATGFYFRPKTATYFSENLISKGISALWLRQRYVLACCFQGGKGRAGWIC